MSIAIPCGSAALQTKSGYLVRTPATHLGFGRVGLDKDCCHLYKVFIFYKLQRVTCLGGHLRVIDTPLGGPYSSIIATPGGSTGDRPCVSPISNASPGFHAFAGFRFLCRAPCEIPWSLSDSVRLRELFLDWSSFET